MIRTLTKGAYYFALDAFHWGKGVPRVVGGASIRFPARCSRYYSPEYESETFEFLRRYCHRGGVAIDVGAHIGLFSVVMGQLVGQEGQVISFEPTPSTRAILEETIRLNRLGARTVVRAEAVASSSGTARFYDTGDYLSNANSLVPSARAMHEVTVPTVTLDRFIADHSLEPCCIKIDAEGAELEVLRGAERTLRRVPAINLALHPNGIAAAGASLSEIWDLLVAAASQIHFQGSEVGRDWFCSRGSLFDVWVLRG